MDRISKMGVASSLAITVGLLYSVCGVVVAMHPGALGIRAFPFASAMFSGAPPKNLAGPPKKFA